MTLCSTSTSVSPGVTLGSGSWSPDWGSALCTWTGGSWRGSGSPTPCSLTPGPPASTPSQSQTGQMRKNWMVYLMSFCHRFIRLTPEGRVVYSQRLTVSLPCSVQSAKYPLDEESCYLNFSSFSRSKYLFYKWAEWPISVAEIRS